MLPTVNVGCMSVEKIKIPNVDNLSKLTKIF